MTTTHRPHACRQAADRQKRVVDIAVKRRRCAESEDVRREQCALRRPREPGWDPGEHDGPRIAKGRPNAEGIGLGEKVADRLVGECQHEDEPQPVGRDGVRPPRAIEDPL